MKTKPPKRIPRDGRRLFSFQRHRPKRQTPPDWPPADIRLPDSIEQIEQGRPEPTAGRDQSRAARLERLCSIEGVQRADTLEVHP